MLMFLLGFAACYVLSLVVFLISEQTGYWVEEIFFAPVSAVLLVVCFIPATLWFQFKNVVKAAPHDKTEYLKKHFPEDEYHNLFGNIWMVKDNTTKYWYKKIWFYREKRG